MWGYDRMSRQYKWQLKQISKKCCVICGKVAVTKLHCQKHAQKQVGYVRKANRKKILVLA
jgi:hypothetical protein